MSPAASRPDPPAFHERNSLVVLLFGFVTLGVYWAVWFWRQAPALDALDAGARFGGKRVRVMGVLAGASALTFPFFLANDPLWVPVHFLTSLAFGVLAFWESLRVRRALTDGTGTHASLVLTLLFFIPYLQYRMNAITRRGRRTRARQVASA